MFVGDRGTGVGSRVKGFRRYGGKQKEKMYAEAVNFFVCYYQLTSRITTQLPIYVSIQKGRCDIDKIFSIILTDRIKSWEIYPKRTVLKLTRPIARAENTSLDLAAFLFFTETHEGFVHMNVPFALLNVVFPFFISFHFV